MLALSACTQAAAPSASAPSAGTGPATPPQSASTAQSAPVTVRLGLLNSASDSGLWIAIAKKYFEDEGITPDITNFASAAEMVAPLGAGQLDVGGGAPGVGLDNAVLRGLDIK